MEISFDDLSYTAEQNHNADTGGDPRVKEQGADVMGTESGNKTSRTDGARVSRGLHGAALAMVLLAVGADGLCAEPTAGKPLPDGAVVSGLDGRLAPAEAGNAWWFELAAEFKTDNYCVPAGTRFTLLPSATLERLIVDVNDRYTPQYRLAAQVTRYQGASFLLVTYFLPLSKFKSDEKTEDGGRRAEDGAVGLPADSGLAIPAEIVEKLKNQRPIHGPLRKPGAPEQDPRPAGQDYLGRMLVDRVGIIETGGGRPQAGGASSQFIPYALGWNISNVRYELLPCGVLEHAQQIQRGSMEPIRFNVAGLVTQFRGRQYLLLQRAVPVYNYGNFGR